MANSINLDNRLFAIKELTLGQAIEIAKIDNHLHEKKISQMLGIVLDDVQLAYELTLQERHYLIMKYVELKKEVFNYDIDFSSFEKEGLANDAVEVDGFVFRHLNGYECEALESYATCYLDWVMGSIAQHKTHTTTKTLLINRINSSFS